MLVTVIIPSCTAKLDYLRRCIGDMLSSLSDHVKITVVFDPKDDDDRLNLEEYPSVKIINLNPNQNKQQSLAIDVGARQATTPYLWIQDDDALLRPNDYRLFIQQAQLMLDVGCDLVTAASFSRIHINTDNVGDMSVPSYQLISESEIAMECSLTSKNAWWFTGQPKIIRRSALLDVSTFHSVFKHYWWWDVCVSAHLERQYCCASIPIHAFLLEHERKSYREFEDQNRQTLQAYLSKLEFKPDQELEGKARPDVLLKFKPI